MALMRKLLMTLGGLFLVVGSLAVSSVLMTGTASAQSQAGAATKCAYPSKCAGLTSNKGSGPPGSPITLSGHGYKPGSTVTISVCGITSYTVTVNSSGDFTITVDIPASAVPGTVCVITATGIGPNGQPLTTSTSVLVTSGVPVPPVHTGEPWAASLYWILAGGSALLGLSLFELGRRRRRLHPTA